MKTKIKKLAFYGSIIIVIIGFAGCVKKQPRNIPKVELEIWGVFDDSDMLKEINTKFSGMNPYVSGVNYKKIASNIADFETQFVNAMANGTGPDIIYFKNSWLPKHGDKIIPMPNSAQALTTFKKQFVDVAYNDFVYKNNIYAKPLYCDTLALYYNNDLLNQVGIVSPPKTWNELKKDVKLLTKVDDYGNIKQSGIALGRAENPGAVNRAGDIVMLMMLQGGAVMNNENSLEADFSNSKFPNVNPGIGALKFFTSFADGSSQYYTWNTKQDYSVDSFRYGRTAMMINYSYWHDRLKRSDPKLDFNIAPVPQTNSDNSNKVNFASYWGLAVTKNRKIPIDANYNQEERIKQSWNYINFITNTAQQNRGYDATVTYLENTHKPPARRDLVESMKNDLALGVFAQQALTAKNWRQIDNNAIDKIFREMIDTVNRGAMVVSEAVQTAEERVNALVRK
jgi:ABC-type glycerol-3-phosphate transport system substrate-binding protein